jgi:hypothetical protein
LRTIIGVGVNLKFSKKNRGNPHLAFGGSNLEATARATPLVAPKSDPPNVKWRLSLFFFGFSNLLQL